MSNDTNEEEAVKKEGSEVIDVDAKTDEEKKEEGKSDDVEVIDEAAEKKKQEELKKKYADWPLRAIKDPHDNDVMYGRGGGTNHHPGNKRYRKMVEDRKLEYVNSKRLDKPLVALEIIRLWRAQTPPGRFLKLDEKTGLWHDVGDKKAREKTSQALREKAPLIRKQQEDERKDDDEEDEKPPSGTKTTRFAEGTKKESGQVRKAILARDHSLGREYLQAGESVSLDGFSWQDPFKAGKEKRKGSFTAPPGASHPPPPSTAPPPPSQISGSYPPAGRNSSHGSLGMAPPHHTTSVGGPPPPPPPDYYGRVTSDGQPRQYSIGRAESWGSSSYGYPPPPPPPGMQGAHQRSGSWTQQPPPTPAPHAPSHQRSGSWNGRDHATLGREHSLSFNPLANASVAHPADKRAFESRSSSGYWGEGRSSSTSMPGPPPPPPGAYGGGSHQFANGSAGPYRQPISPSNSGSPSNGNSPKPPYSVDVNIAKAWSGGTQVRGWAADQDIGPSFSHESYDGHPRPVPGADHSPMRMGSASLPRPQMVKRDTSHQNENYETKPSVKRAALNRDNSMASNRLKQEYMPEYYNGVGGGGGGGGRETFDTHMNMLSDNLQQSTLDAASQERPRPQPLGDEGRVSTMDAIAMDLLVKPAPLLEGNRVSTIDALDLDLDEDPMLKPVKPERMDRGQPRDEERRSIPKPSAVTPTDRLTTQDFLEMVNAPIEDDERPLMKPQRPRDDDPLPLNQEHITDKWLTQV